jgi:two-component system, LytTR family, response regulator
MTIRCIAIDDEPFALGIIADYCARVPFLQLEKTFSSGIEAINYLKRNPVDLVFLDIEMRDINGLQVMEIVKPMPMVILTTAYEQYALKSYEYSVLDYLLKPISFDRFLKATTKALEKTPASDVSSNNNQKTSSDFIFVKSGYSTVKINFADIYYIEGQRDYLLIRTEKEKIMTLQSFKQLEEVLPASDFLRVHKSYIVALPKINKIERNRIRILDIDIPVGDSYRDAFSKAIKGNGV